MMNPYLTLEGVSYVLPDGRTLFSDLNETFGRRHTGLIGRSGAGKLYTVGVHYLAQQVSAPVNATAAGLAGVRHRLEVLARIGAGSAAYLRFNVSHMTDARGLIFCARDRNTSELAGMIILVPPESGARRRAKPDEVARCGAQLSRQKTKPRLNL